MKKLNDLFEASKEIPVETMHEIDAFFHNEGGSRGFATGPSYNNTYIVGTDVDDRNGNGRFETSFEKKGATWYATVTSYKLPDSGKGNARRKVVKVKNKDLQQVMKKVLSEWNITNHDITRTKGWPQGYKSYRK